MSHYIDKIHSGQLYLGKLNFTTSKKLNVISLSGNNSKDYVLYHSLQPTEEDFHPFESTKKFEIIIARNSKKLKFDVVFEENKYRLYVNSHLTYFHGTYPDSIFLDSHTPAIQSDGVDYEVDNEYASFHNKKNKLVSLKKPVFKDSDLVTQLLSKNTTTPQEIQVEEVTQETPIEEITQEIHLDEVPQEIHLEEVQMEETQVEEVPQETKVEEVQLEEVTQETQVEKVQMEETQVEEVQMEETQVEENHLEVEQVKSLEEVQKEVMMEETKMELDLEKIRKEQESYKYPMEFIETKNNTKKSVTFEEDKNKVMEVIDTMNQIEKEKKELETMRNVNKESNEFMKIMDDYRELEENNKMEMEMEKSQMENRMNMVSYIEFNHNNKMFKLPCMKFECCEYMDFKNLSKNPMFEMNKMNKPNMAIHIPEMNKYYLITYMNTKYLFYRNPEMLIVTNIQNRKNNIIKNKEIFKLGPFDYLLTNQSSILVPMMQKKFFDNHYGTTRQQFIPRI